MAHELDGLRVKINRAYENIQNIGRERIKLLKSGTYDIRRETDVQAGFYRYYVSIKVEKANAALMRLSVLTGEVVYQLRSALDHLAWQLVMKTGIDPTTLTGRKRVEFPIYADPDKYRAEGTTKIQAAVEGAPEAIEGLQPYHRPNGFADDPLWIIHNMNVVDKHRLLVVTATAIRLPPQRIAAVTLAGPGMVQITDLYDGKNFMDIGVSQGHKDPKLRFEIVFDQVGTAGQEPVVETLQSLADFTVKLIDAFDNKFFT